MIRSERRDDAAEQRRPRGRLGGETCERNLSGKVKRHPAARREFRQSHPCPSTGLIVSRCDGYVIDHVVALKRGGPDTADNNGKPSQNAKQKDRVE